MKTRSALYLSTAFILVNFASMASAQAPKASPPTLLAFQGGGLRAMTSGAGLLAGALQGNSGQTLQSLLAKTSAVSGNSGGTWLASCLAYSPHFVTSLESYNSFFNQTNGYMGQVGINWANLLLKSKTWANADASLLLSALVGRINQSSDVLGFVSFFSGLIKSPVLNYDYILSETIFKPNNFAQTLKSTNFHAADPTKRLGALKSQSLIFEAAISSNGGVIGKFDNLNNQTTSVATNVGKDTSNVFPGYNNAPYIFIPASITSLGKSSDVAAPALPTVSGGNLNISYSHTCATNGCLFQGTPSTVSMPNFNFNGVSVFTATQASSSVGAVVESKGSLYANNVLGSALFPNTILNSAMGALKEMAAPIDIKFAGKPLRSTAYDHPPATGLTYPVIGTVTPAQLATMPILRLADGGYIDNGGVTSGITYLQKNFGTNFANTSGNQFNVTLFATYLPVTGNTSDTSGLVRAYPQFLNIDADTRVLFTGSNQQQIRAGLNTSHPSAAIFDAAATTGLTTPIWTYTDPNDKTFSISLYRLGVVTVANTFGINKGIHGTFNIWMVHTTAKMFPIPAAANIFFAQYSKLFNQIRAGLQTTYKNHTGAYWLSSTLGN